MPQSETIQSAVNDLAVIRRAIERAHSTDKPTNKFAIDAGIFLQGLCLVISILLIAFELMSDRSMTTIMMLSAQDTELGVLGLAQVAVALPTLVLCIYFVVWRASRYSDQTFQDYLVRNFRYLRNLALVSDLFVKFVPLSLLVMGGHPEWISPLLSLYIADYLIQGRFFTFPIRWGLILGVISLAMAAAQYLGHSTQLLLPLTHFSAVTIASLAYLFSTRADHTKSLRAE